MKISQEGEEMISFMLTQLSQLGYFYKSIAEECYESGINNYSLKEPKETKDFIIKKVIIKLKEMK